MKSILCKPVSGRHNPTPVSLLPSLFTLHNTAFILLLFFSSAVPPAHAGPLDDGLRAFNAGDYVHAHDIWKPLAQQGNARAQYNLALLYENGKGVEQHLRTALTLYRAAAEQGYAPAQYNLGQMYARAKSVFKSHRKAAYWWEKAAAQDHPDALFNLGVLYAYGNGVKKDPEHALELWEKSAMLGYPRARQTLVRVYENGEFDLQKDPGRADYWKQRQ